MFVNNAWSSFSAVAAVATREKEAKYNELTDDANWDRVRTLAFSVFGDSSTGVFDFVKLLFGKRVDLDTSNDNRFSKQVFIRNLSTILARWNGCIALGVLSKGYINFFDPCRRGRSTSYQGG